MITFFYMEGCVYCKKAKSMLEKEIADGTISVRPHSEAPEGVNGFPYFSKGDKNFIGAPSSKEELFEKLGVSQEVYSHATAIPDCARAPAWPGGCNMYTDKWWKAGVL